MSDAGNIRQDAPGANPVAQATRAQENITVVEDEDNSPTPEDVIEGLRKQIEELEGKSDSAAKRAEEEQRLRYDAEVARRQAEERASAAQAEAQRASQESQRSTSQAQLDAVSAALDARMGQLEAMQSALAKANADGEFEAAAKIQGEMTILGGEIATLKGGKATLEERVKTDPQDTGRQQQQQQQTPSPYEQREAFIRQRPPSLQNWLRGPNGDRFFNDRAFQARVIAAANFAEQVRGMSPADDGYVNYIEEQVGLRQPAANRDTGEVQQTSQRGRDADEGRRMTAAPAGGATGGSVRSNPDGSTTVRLTKSEMEIADSIGVSHAEYARQKKALIEENLIGPNARR